MATSYIPLQFPPGVYRNGTEFQSAGRYYDSNLVRFVDGTIRPVGGWRVKSTTVMSGSPRAIITWQDNSNPPVARAAIGTSSKLYTMARTGVLTNITPIRASGTYANNPLSVTNTSAVVTVAHTSHGLTTGDTAVIAGSAAIGGITPNGTFTVTVTDANTFTYTFTSPATSTVSGGGGAAVTYSYEISPGLASATTGGGYGSGNYGAGTYGTPRPDTTNITPARMWSLDTWGEYLVGTPGASGDIYQWQLNTSNRAAKITNSPTARAILVTEERILMALGAAGNPRKVQWSDQEDNTDWTPSATNLSGDFDLQTSGKLMCGKHVKGGILLLTDTDAHLARFIGYPLVYGFEGLAHGCGVISQGAAADLDTLIIWMGENGFWMFDGYVRPIPCDVADHVFTDMNRLQASKIVSVVNAAFNEVWWFYPSGSSTENDRYVSWNYKEGTWAIGTVSRLAGCDKGAMLYPLKVASDGYVYEHQVGFDYDEADVYVESGPIQLGNGERLMDVLNYIPDENTAGDVTVTFYAKMFPNGAETTYGPYTAANPRNLRFSARQVRVRYTGATMSDWRVGINRLEVQQGSRR